MISNNEQLDRIEWLLLALASSQDLVQWVDSFVLGANEGGRVVALFGAGTFPNCKVYEEAFDRLPPFVNLAINEMPSRDELDVLPQDKNAAERAGRLVPCRAFQIVRFMYPGSEKWRYVSFMRYGRPSEVGVGYRVLVLGQNDNRFGTVVSQNGGGLFGVEIGDEIYNISPERLVVISKR